MISLSCITIKTEYIYISNIYLYRIYIYISVICIYIYIKSNADVYVCMGDGNMVLTWFVLCESVYIIVGYIITCFWGCCCFSCMVKGMDLKCKMFMCIIVSYTYNLLKEQVYLVVVLCFVVGYRVYRCVSLWVWEFLCVNIQIYINTKIL